MPTQRNLVFVVGSHQIPKLKGVNTVTRITLGDRMKMTLLTLTSTVALLADCVNAEATVTLNTLTIGGIESTLLIDAPAKLTVTATGSDGKPFLGIPTFTSSDPNIVTVSADGTLTVKHLNLKPVILTATENGKSATMNIDTYGLDVTGGTYLDSFNTDAPGYIFILAFRDANGSPLTKEAIFNIQGPVAFNHGAPIVRPMNKGATVQSYAWKISPTVPVISGAYTASGMVAGVMFKKTFTIDATQVQAIPSDVNVKFDAFKYTATGKLPDGSPLVYGVLYLDTHPGTDQPLGQRIAYVDNFGDLPVTGKFNQSLTSGTYFIGVFAQSYHEENYEAFPDQINISVKMVKSVIDPRPAGRNNTRLP